MAPHLTSSTSYTSESIEWTIGETLVEVLSCLTRSMPTASTQETCSPATPTSGVSWPAILVAQVQDLVKSRTLSQAGPFK
jgi:hypothetical protein